MRKKLLIIQVAALGYDLLRCRQLDQLRDLTFRPAHTVFPALTCTVQASFRTASLPSEHGMISNGRFFRDLARPMFWEQSSRLVSGRRIWNDFRRRGGRVGMLFWQQSLGEDVDLVLSPAPIHKHHGGMIQDCHSRPPGLYAKLCGWIGRPFKLQHYWGPLAAAKVGDWIVSATAAIMREEKCAPDLLLTYLPSLDYDLQRWGTHHQRTDTAVRKLVSQLEDLTCAAQDHGYEALMFGDYAIADVNAAVFPNRALSEAGLMATREVKGMLYPDIHTSKAFAMVDHEMAHVYVRETGHIGLASEVLSAQPGVAEVLVGEALGTVGVDHPNSGELVLIAERGKWFAYPWWAEKRQAPDYASHVDIHNKPGYDPCELFFGWPPFSVSQDACRIRGSHGRVGLGREIAWASTLDFADAPTSLLELAAATRDWLDSTR